MEKSRAGYVRTIQPEREDDEMIAADDNGACQQPETRASVQLRAVLTRRQMQFQNDLFLAAEVSQQPINTSLACNLTSISSRPASGLVCSSPGPRGLRHSRARHCTKYLTKNYESSKQNKYF